jgi:ubiquinone/menaquinone biosynthesis C-methylase UbiE
MKNFLKYSNENVHFYSTALPKLLKTVLENEKIDVLADVGCGDGQILYACYESGLISKAKIYAIDLSEKRIERIKERLPNVSGIVSDARKISVLPDSCLDLIINSQVIEHIEDQETMLYEFHRLLKNPYINKNNGGGGGIYQFNI